MNIKNARVAVIAINDAIATRQITQQIKRMNPVINLLVRTRFVNEVEPLRKLGADEVIPEEFETSIEIFARVLAKYLVPGNEINKIISGVRAHNYNAFRTLSNLSGNVSDLKNQLSDIDFCTIRIEMGNPLSGKSILESDIRKKYGVSIVALSKGEQILTNPEPSTILNENDIVYLFGTHGKLAEVQSMFSNKS